MRSQWNDAEAQEFIDRFAPGSNEHVALRVYSSRLIGRDPRLVLHGGGNTSVKTELPDRVTGRPVSVLCVEGSGWDLADIDPAGLPAVRLEPLRGLRGVDALSDAEMVFGDDVPSGLWAEVGPERMKARGLDPEGLRAFYRDRSLLKVEVTPRHVGLAVVFFASNATPTTGAVLPVDAGVPAAFPR